MAVTQQEIENRLWDAADELRVAMPEAQYSSVVFPLMLLYTVISYGVFRGKVRETTGYGHH